MRTRRRGENPRRSVRRWLPLLAVVAVAWAVLLRRPKGTISSPAVSRRSGDRLPDDYITPTDLPTDPEVPTADALDQARTAAPPVGMGPVSSDPEAPEADAIDQAIAVPPEPD
jgi:hypothetical protein